MAFEKKWTDEQNKRILELHQSKTKIEDIAKEFNTTEKIISQRIYHLKNKEKKRLKKEKTKLKKEQKDNSSLKNKSNTSSEIEVSEAPLHKEAETLRQEYLNPESSEIKDEQQAFSQQDEIGETSQEIKSPEIQKKVNWKGTPETIIAVIDSRFKKNNLQPLEDWEKEQFVQSGEACLEQYAGFMSNHANLISLGLATISILIPRILQHLEIKKQLEIEEKKIHFQPPTLPIPQVKVIDEKAEADKRFEQAMQGRVQVL